MRPFWILTALFAGCAMMAPVTMDAQGRSEKHQKKEKSYYDRDNRQYRSWNDNEDRAFRLYLGEQHRQYRDPGREKAAQQRLYFRWRNEHPDNMLFKLEIR